MRPFHGYDAVGAVNEDLAFGNQLPVRVSYLRSSVRVLPVPMSSFSP